MKYPFPTCQLLDDSDHSGRSDLSKFAPTSVTRRKRNTGRRYQSPLEPLVSAFDRWPPENSGLLYGLLKRSIIGGP